MEKSVKEAFWSDHIAGWQESGLSQKKYCQQHGLHLGNFSYWRTRQNKRKRKFLPLSTPLGTLPDQVIVDLPYGLRLEMSAPALQQLLPSILQTLRETAQC